MIKILLAEDHNIVRNGISSLLNSQSDLEIVGEATDGLEVLKFLDEGIDVDLVLTDINMPNLNGIELIAKVKSHSPATKVIVLSMLDHENYVMEAIKNGASGYLLKNVSEEEMVFAIRHVFGGFLYVCSEMTLKILEKLSKFSKSGNSERQMSIDLSKREIEILFLIAEGYTNNEIAEKLFTSRRTVEGHRQNLLEKTGARNTATLIRFAVRSGLIE